MIYADTKEGVAGFRTEIERSDRNLIVLSSKNDLDLLRETIAHELGHEVENAEGFEKIKKAAVKSTKEEERDGWARLYRRTFPELTDAEIEAEIAAKTIGRRLATPRFLERYANRSTLRRLIDGAKAMIKKLRANSEELLAIKETEKLIKMMDEAIIRNAVSQNAGNGESGTKYMIVDNNGKKFVAIETQSIASLSKYKGETLSAKVRNYLKQYRGTVLPLGTTDKAYMRREAEGEYTNPAKEISDVEYLGKLNAASEIQNLLKSSSFIRHEADNGRHKDATRGWNYYELQYVVPVGDKLYAYQGEIQIKLIDRGDVFYDITKIRDITNGAAGQALIKAAGSVYNASTNNSISQTTEKSTPSAKKSHNLTPEAAERAAQDAAEVEAFRNQQKNRSRS